MKYSNEYIECEFIGRNFVGKKVIADVDFIGALHRIDAYAEYTGVKVYVTSSSRELNKTVEGAIVKPASNSCHYVGHAIDKNLICENKFYNSAKLKKENHENLPAGILKFIDCIRNDSGLRWGGDFQKEDVVHIDDNLYHTHKDIYLSKIASRINEGE